MFISFYQFLVEHGAALQQKTFEHIALAGSSIFLASTIAIPLGIMMAHVPLLRKVLLNVGSISQTIPSLALLAFLVPFLGLGNTPTLVVLTFYALYPILRSTVAGLQSVPPECKEAAEGLGLSHFQKLWFVELPLALPIIMSGVRVATAATIGITTIAAFIGAGGLGDFITQGLALNNSSLILLGALPTALLALGFDYALSQLEIYLNYRKETSLPFSSLKKILFGIASIILLVWVGHSLSKEIFFKPSKSIVIASKNFTEQHILAELMAQLIEAKTDLTVIRKFNLGTTVIVHQALLRGDIDLYPEYTGTAYMIVLKESWNTKEKDILEKVRNSYKNKFNLLWLGLFGFSNSQALAVKKKFAEDHRITSLSELSQISDHLKIAAQPDTLKREDGLPGLSNAYGLNFKNIMQVDSNLLFTAIAHEKVDVIAVSTTDGKLQAFDLVTLEDDKNFYPPYQAAPVIREVVLKTYPELHQVLSPLFGFISQQKISKLNYEVDVKCFSPAEAAHKFLLEFNLL
ncbi:MAG: ABC transporter permease subunit [Proteobacteria bacterium]|nr:ABC transporter permease subunit [Pseudomonadota bacterium]